MKLSKTQLELLGNLTRQYQEPKDIPASKKSLDELVAMGYAQERNGEYKGTDAGMEAYISKK